ncbi:hypothetical protein niasHT_026535 [Heterodera trifolii]|uniref:Uncharacterized protein n=1 Tax=Heterodera trifolii TaxID=157864 RepID=A0ABD2KT36_9BILA
MGKRNLLPKIYGKKGAKEREKKRGERQEKLEKARQAKFAKKTAPPPNPNAETPQQDEAGPSTSAASAEEAMEPPPPTPGPVPTPEMDEELLEFGFSLPSTPATPIGDLVPFPSTPIAPMDIGEMTPPPLVIDDRSERIEQLEMELKDRDDTIQFLREQVRNRDALITALRRQLEQCAPPPTATPTTSKTTPTGRPKKNVDHLQRTSRRKLAEESKISQKLNHFRPMNWTHLNTKLRSSVLFWPKNNGCATSCLRNRRPTYCSIISSLLLGNTLFSACWTSRGMRRCTRFGEDWSSGGNACRTLTKLYNNWSTILSAIGFSTPRLEDQKEDNFLERSDDENEEDAVIDVVG